jgi:hypothetical protein
MEEIKTLAINYLKEYLSLSSPTKNQTDKAHVALTFLRDHSKTESK